MRKILKGGEYEKMRVRFYFVNGKMIFVIEKSTNEIKSHLKNGRKKKRYTLFYSVKILQCQNSTVSDFRIRKRNTGALLHAWQRLFA